MLHEYLLKCCCTVCSGMSPTPADLLRGNKRATIRKLKNKKIMLKTDCVHNG